MLLLIATERATLQPAGSLEVLAARSIAPVTRDAAAARPLRGVGQVVGLRPEAVETYEALHPTVWPSVLERIRASNFHAYSIFRHEDRLFAYFEYTGLDYESDFASLAADPATRAWWSLTDPLQRRPGATPPDVQWLTLPEILHVD